MPTKCLDSHQLWDGRLPMHVMGGPSRIAGICIPPHFTCLYPFSSTQLIVRRGFWMLGYLFCTVLRREGNLVVMSK